MPLMRIAGVGIQLHSFLISALDGGELLASRPGRFIPGERVPCTRWIGGKVGPSACQKIFEKRKSVTSAFHRRIDKIVALLRSYAA